MSTDNSKLVVDCSKPVQTRDGSEVRIYTTEGGDSERPVVGEYFTAGRWLLVKWLVNGRVWDEREDQCDLVNVPQQHTVTGNVYRPGGGCNGTLHICLFDSRDKADKSATYDRIACIPVTFTEGEGL